MGRKYEVLARDYTAQYWLYQKDTRWLIVALLCFVVQSIKHDVVQMYNYGNGRC